MRRVGGGLAAGVGASPIDAPTPAPELSSNSAAQTPLGPTPIHRRSPTRSAPLPAGGPSSTAMDQARASLELQLGGQVSRVIEALTNVSKMVRVPTPARLTVKEDKGRPAMITGYLDRSVVGTLDAPRAKLQFSPIDRELAAFPLDPRSAEGLRSGARVTLALERAEGGEQVYAVKADASAYAAQFLATVALEDGKPVALGLSSAPIYSKVPLPGAEALVGQKVIVDVSMAEDPARRVGTVRRAVGPEDGVSARLLEAAIREGVDVGHSAAAMAEVKALLANPRIEGPDLTHLPFITIDNVGSKDLDQAMCLQERPDGGYELYYAIADVAHFIPPGSALDQEAKRRTVTAFLADGTNVPMLPRELSEGLISLLPDQRRRAFVVHLTLDAEGRVTGRDFQRGVIQSRQQLAYSQVQAEFDRGRPGVDPSQAGEPWAQNLRLLRALGEKRVALADARGVVPSAEEPAQLSFHDGRLQLVRRARNDVEKWNEQISLLANEAVGQTLRTAGVRAMYRTHGTPPPEKLDAFRDLVGVLGAPWDESRSLAQYLRELDPQHPMFDVVQRLSTSVNQPASYLREYGGGHSGLKLEDYVHFTAPMRRYVDVVAARVLAALVEKTPVPYQADDDRLLRQLESLTEEAHRRESQLESRQGAVLATVYFGQRLGETLEGRVVGVRPSGIKVELAGGGPTVSMPVSALGQGSGTLEAFGSRITVGDVSYRYGDPIKVRPTQIDAQNDRVAFAVV